MKITDPLPIPTVSKPIQGSIKLPGSKSLTNRALILAALATGKSTIKNHLIAEDTQVMLASLQQLGIKIENNKDSIEVHGQGGKFLASSKPIFVAGSGTSARFLTPLLNLGIGDYIIDGNQRIRQRPIGELIAALKQINCQITPLKSQDSLPLKIKAQGFLGGNIKLDSSISSQFISGLMLIAPLAKKNTTITLQNKIVSLPYIEMTKKIMESFGVYCEWQSENQLFIPAKQKYKPQNYLVEGDVSAASYFAAMAAITLGKITMSPIFSRSSQGDLGFLQILKEMGCQVEWDKHSLTVIGKKMTGTKVNMRQMSDVALTLAVTALFAKGKTTIEDIYNLRVKESDRIEALATELTKLGADVTQTKDSITISSCAKYQGATIETYHDHRIAMSFALCGLKIDAILIKNPTCVDKTFPNYWSEFFKLTNK